MLKKAYFLECCKIAAAFGASPTNPVGLRLLEADPPDPHVVTATHPLITLSNVIF